MRLIDADALMKEMDEHFLHIGRAEEVRDIINSLPTITPRPGWTPYAEGKRLPKDFEQCLISYRICDQWRVEEAWMRNGKWCTRYGIISSLDRIDAWMPKPEPYNPDRKDDADHIVDANKKMDLFREPTKRREICPMGK